MDPATNPKPAGKSTNSGASTDAGAGPRSLTGEQIQRMARHTIHVIPTCLIIQPGAQPDESQSAA